MATILVPLDTSESADTVLAQAKKLALRVQGRLELFHVIEPVATYVPVGASMDVIATSPPEIGTEDVEIARQRMETLASSLAGAPVEITCKAVLGMAVDEILEEAKALSADYIVLGSHGHGALYHLFSGSVATGVLKHSPCPVLIVPVRRS
jgi:nucleotide-binding universal stress UspA family protein